MKILPSQLEKNGYVLQEKLEHHALIPFVRVYLRQWNYPIVLYFTFNFLILLVCFPLAGYYRHLGAVQPSVAFEHFTYGIALAFLLIPLHEYIHVLAYRSQGATDTSYDVNWKKFYFMAVANHFVANRKEFTVVILAPFAVITITGLVLFLFATPAWQFAVLGALFNHTACCSGDFSMLSFLHVHKDKDVVTFDDAPNKISYFFVKQRTNA